jgi:hypothetical protein
MIILRRSDAREHMLGKGEVESSILSSSTLYFPIKSMMVPPELRGALAKHPNKPRTRPHAGRRLPSSFRAGKAARRIWSMVRTARGQPERGGGIFRVRLDRPQKTPSNQLIQRGPIKQVIKIRARARGPRDPLSARLKRTSALVPSLHVSAFAATRRPSDRLPDA